MNFDTYWGQLVDRVYKKKEELTGADEVFYRLTCIRGETMVSGTEAYLERRYPEFAADMRVLDESGLQDLAGEFRKARIVLFGEQPLDPDQVADIYMLLLDEDPSMAAIQEQLDAISERVIGKIDALDDYRMDYGVRNGLFEKDTES